MVKEKIYPSSGNVFADLGVRNPELHLAKAQLAARIVLCVQKRKLTQAAVGEILGLAQPKVSALLSGRLQGYSSDRLFRFLNALGCDVEITISAPHPRKAGRVKVLAGI